MKAFVEQMMSFTDVRVMGNSDVQITGITDDSRKVEAGFLFIAVKGTASDGHDFVQKAIEKGAIAVLVEKEMESCSVTQFIVPNTQSILSRVAFAFYGNPQLDLKLVGVTGTNGKTTISTLIYQVLDFLGYETGLIGTAGKWIGKKEFPSQLTTPGAIELAQDLAAIRNAGCSHVIMEVSSHALKQHRVDGLSFAVGIFTNLTHDHLDYHGTVEDYAASKQLLFNQLDEQAIAIINTDDAHGHFMASQTRASVWEVSFARNSGNEVLKNAATGLEINFDGSLIESPLVGKFNAYNISQAYLACVGLGVNPNGAIEALRNVPGAVGRLERVQIEPNGDLPSVFVDYAHTPDALENVSNTLKAIKNKDQDLVIVFGCGGNRDAKKRPVMAAIAEKYSDRILVTSDNPRFENPELILDDICKGFSATAVFEREVDRVKAISKAILSSKPSSLILVAGKGHETYQDIEGVKHPMDDKKIALEALQLALKQSKEKGIKN